MQKINLQIMKTKFVELMQLQTFWEWARKHKK